MTLTKILVLNTPARTDRLQHMTEELARWGKTFERVNGGTVPDKLCFKNRYLRSNWISHEECISRARDNASGLTLVLEDDVRIIDFNKIEKSVAAVQEMPAWDALYLYGSGKRGVISRIEHVIDTHAYILNLPSIPQILDALHRQRLAIETGEETQPARSHIDHFIAHVLQPSMNFYGTEILVFQDRKKFGSDMGWGWQGQHKYD